MADNNNPIKYSDLVSPDNSITDLIKQLDELSDSYTNALKNIRGEAIKLTETLKGVSGATEEGRNTTKKAVTDADRLARAQRELNFAQSDTAIELAKIKAAQREANQIAKLVVKANNAEKDSYDELSAQYSLNKITLNSMSRAMREGTKQGQELEKQTREIYEEMKRLQAATGKTSLNVGNYPDLDLSNVESQLKSLVGLNNQFGESLLNLGRGGDVAKSTLSAIGDGAKALGKTLLGLLSNPVFLAIAGIAAAGVVFKWWYDYNAGLVEATRLTQQFTSKEGDDLKNFRNEIQGVADTFNKDFKETLVAANALAKQFGISVDEALGLIKDGFIAGADASGEFLDSVREYPAYFREAGISADQFIAIISQTTKQGIFSDKGIDAIKEANIRLREMTKSTASALDNIGISSKQVQKDLQSGAKTTFDVMQDVSHKLNELPASSSVVGTAIADIFGGPGEDAGLQYLKTLKDIDTNLQIVKESAGELGRLQEEQLRSQIELDNAISALFDQTGGVFERLTTNAKIFINQGITGIIKGIIDIYNYFVELYNESVAFRILWQSITSSVKTFFDVVGNLFNYVIDVIGGVGRALKGMLTLDWDEFKSGMASAFKALPSLINESLKDAKNNLREGVDNLNKEAKPITIPVNVEQVDGSSSEGFKTGGGKPTRTREEILKEEKAVLEARRKFEDAQLALEKEGYEKRRKQIILNYTRQREDIKRELNTNLELTIQQRNYMNQTIIALEQQQQQELLKLDQQRDAQQLSVLKKSIDLRLKAVKKGSTQELQLKIEANNAQRDLELAQNEALPEDQRQSPSEIKAYYDTINREIYDSYLQLELQKLDLEQQMKESQFLLEEHSEARITRFRLQAEKERLQKILELNERSNIKMEPEQVMAIQAQITGLDSQIKDTLSIFKGGKNVDFWEMLGIDMSKEKKEAISESMQFAMDQLNQFMDYRVQMAERAVSVADAEVESAQRALDAEIEARNNGYANNVTMAQKELDNARKNQQKALQEQRKAQKQQAAIQALEQVGSLVTATAKIWASLGSWPPAAIAAIALMWSSFAASKVKAAQLTKNTTGTEEYGEGTVELLQGGSHQSGNDIDLGSKPDGTRRKAEGGEYFAVINKRNSRKFRKYIPSVINSLNNGTFASKYLNAYSGSDGIQINVSQQSNDLKELTDNVREIKDQNKRKTFVDGNGNLVVIYKNKKRIYKNN